MLSFLIDSAGRYLFRELYLPWHFVHHSIPPVRKCNNKRDPYELPDFWPTNSLDTFHYKICGCETEWVYSKKCRRWM